MTSGDEDAREPAVAVPRAPLRPGEPAPPGRARRAPRLELTDVSKHFGGVQALSGARLVIEPGEIHGLLGENGSGKSTMIKILAGYHVPDSGQLRIDGEPQQLPMAAAALRDLGVSFVHQDLGLIDSVTVTENLALRDIATRRGLFISWRQARRDATALLARYGLSVRAEALLSQLTAFERAMVAIVRALEGMTSARSAGRGLLVLDEAMAFLADHERALLTSTARELAAAGTSVLLVSHDLDDALQVCDRITVLRDGRVVGTVDARQIGRDQLASLILGGALAAQTPTRAAHPGRGEDIALTEISGPGMAPASFALRGGEIVGVTGLAGESFARIPYLIYGAEPAARGTLSFQGRSYRLAKMRPPDALRAGIVLVPGDRQRQGAIASLSAGENAALPKLREFFRSGILRSGELTRAMAGLLERFQVRPASPQTLMGNLSGGNQQKTIIAKWLQIEPRLLLLDEPTIGVDVGSRAQISAQIRQLAARGTAVLCASNDYAQLAELCDRVLVFAGGQLRAELAASSLTKEAILAQCLSLSGETRPAEP